MIQSVVVPGGQGDRIKFEQQWERYCMGLFWIERARMKRDEVSTWVGLVCLLHSGGVDDLWEIGVALY